MMAANESLMATYCRLIAAEIKQFLLHKLQIQNSQVWAVCGGGENYIFWQPMAARFPISLWEFYGTHMVAICR
jgi:hypothetical protein